MTTEALKDEILAVLTQRGLQGEFEGEALVHWFSGSMWVCSQLSKLEGEVTPQQFGKALEGALEVVGTIVNEHKDDEKDQEQEGERRDRRGDEEPDGGA